MGMKVTSLLKRSRGGVTGATLVEVMLAIIILSVLVIGSASFLTHGSGRMAIYRNRMAAFEIANSRLEAWRLLDYSSLAAGTYTEAITGAGPITEVKTVVQSITGPTHGYFLVTVTVPYRAGSSDLYDRVKLETYIGWYK